MIIPIASDHAGFQAKEFVKKMIAEMDHEIQDFGTFSEDSVDYPDYAVQVSKKVSDGTYNRGILICGSGQGMCMTANKFPNVRASLVWNKEIAEVTVQHNNSNVLCLPGRFLTEDELLEIVTAWLNATFEGGRHQRRVDKITQLTC